MPVVLPFRPAVGNYRFGAILGGSQYVFDVRWNSREAAFFFDVLEADLTPIVRGVKAVLGVYYGRHVNHPLFRDGAMVARVPQGADRSEPTFFDFGDRVSVWYFTRDEVVEEILADLQGR